MRFILVIVGPGGCYTFLLNFRVLHPFEVRLSVTMILQFGVSKLGVPQAITCNGTFQT
jgi:hypothetical protein